METQRMCKSELIEKSGLKNGDEFFSNFCGKEGSQGVDNEIELIGDIQKFKVIGLESGGFLGIYGMEIYYFVTHCLQIPLPQDYEHSILGICQIFVNKLYRIDPNDNKTLEIKIFTFIKALNQVIYNLSINTSDIFEIVQEYLNKLHYKLTDSLIKNLNRLLDEAAQTLKMPQKVKKFFFIELNLKTQQELFIQEMIQLKVLRLEKISQLFNSHFSHFIKEANYNSINFLISSFFEDQINENENIKSSVKIGLIQSLMLFIKGLTFIRVGIFSCKLTEDRKIVDGNWVLIICLVLQNEVVKMERPVNLTSRILLFPLVMRSGSFLIYYSSSTPPTILKKFESSSILIAVGSSMIGALIVDRQLQTNFYYSLNLNQLVFNFNLNFDLKFNETVTSIIYLEDSKKVVYIINETFLYTQKIDTSIRVEIQILQRTEKLHSLYYSKELDYICLKTEKKLIVFNLYMQVLVKIDIDGSDVIALKENKMGWFWVLGENSLSLIQAQFNNKKVDYRTSFMMVEIEKCINSMSGDFLPEMKSSSKYTNFIMNSFKVPDFGQDLKKNHEKPDCLFSPNSILFSIYSSQSEQRRINSDSSLGSKLNSFISFQDLLVVVPESDEEYLEDKSQDSLQCALNEEKDFSLLKLNSSSNSITPENTIVDLAPHRAHTFNFSNKTPQHTKNFSVPIKSASANPSPTNRIFNYIVKSHYSDNESDSSSDSS